jgi:predicted nucleotidyltransferase
MTGDEIDEETLRVALHIMDLLERSGVRSALVGAVALAAHGYSRATEDVDIGVAIADLNQLKRIAEEMRAATRLELSLALPDADDPLGGVATLTGPAVSQIQLVNFINPIGRGEHPGRAGVTTARPLSNTFNANIVDLPHLVAMKLAAGGLKSLGDVVELLFFNPDADLVAIEKLCAGYHLDRAWRSLLPEIQARRE